MHIPDSLQDLADSEAVQFLKRPKTVTRIFAGVSPWPEAAGAGSGAPSADTSLGGRGKEPEAADGGHPY